jgi:hypothetical protein
VVDELSLVRPGPVRVQGRCRNPDAIKGHIELFFNGVGYPVKFEVEGPKELLGMLKVAPLALENLGALTKKETLNMTRKETGRRGVASNLTEWGK